MKKDSVLAGVALLVLPRVDVCPHPSGPMFPGLLLGLRKGAHGAGTWSPPGGRVEPGEDPMEAALRETFEETGVVILPRYLNEGEIQVTNVVVDAQPWLTVFYIAVIDFIPEAVVKEPDKCGGWRLSRDRYLDKDFPLFKPFEEYVVRYGWPQLNEG